MGTWVCKILYCTANAVRSTLLYTYTWYVFSFGALLFLSLCLLNNGWCLSCVSTRLVFHEPGHIRTRKTHTLHTDRGMQKLKAEQPLPPPVIYFVGNSQFAGDSAAPPRSARQLPAEVREVYTTTAEIERRMTCGWGMATAGMLVRTAAAMSLAPRPMRYIRVRICTKVDVGRRHTCASHMCCNLQLHSST